MITNKDNEFKMILNSKLYNEIENKLEVMMNSKSDDEF